MIKRITLLVMLMAVSFSFIQAQTGLLGAGATFPYPLYSKMFDVYNKTYKVQVNYQAIGSGGGIKQLTEKTIDFGGTDAFMNDKEMAATGGTIIHVPTCLGAVVVAYNLPGNDIVKFSPNVLADIFLGKIKKWNDPQLVKINTGIKMPDLPITVVHRSDGSGTTFIFTDYLSKVSPSWKSSVGVEKSVNWPVGLGAKGNAGVAGIVNQTPGSIGYTELIYAMNNKMTYGMIQNKAGKYIKADLNSVSLAAQMSIPNDTRISLTNTDAKDGYPISGFTWIVIYKEQNYGNRTLDKAKNTVSLIRWMLADGQKYAQEMTYSPLPADAVKKAKKLLDTVTYNGKKI